MSLSGLTLSPMAYRNLWLPQGEVMNNMCVRVKKHYNLFMHSILGPKASLGRGGKNNFLSVSIQYTLMKIAFSSMLSLNLPLQLNFD